MSSTQSIRIHSALDEIPLLYVPERGIFIAKQNFVKGFNHHSGLRITGISQNFHEYFLDGEGIIDVPTPRIALQHRDVQTRPVGMTAAEELRLGEVIHLSQIHYVATAEPKIGRGQFLVAPEADGSVGNLFPVDDIKGVRRLAYVFPYFSGLAFAAIPVPAPGSPVQEGHRVFTRYRCS